MKSSDVWHSAEVDKKSKTDKQTQIRIVMIDIIELSLMLAIHKIVELAAIARPGLQGCARIPIYIIHV